eukprot:6913063-Karenia_brevis.AAC.1
MAARSDQCLLEADARMAGSGNFGSSADGLHPSGSAGGDAQAVSALGSMPVQEGQPAGVDPSGGDMSVNMGSQT